MPRDWERNFNSTLRETEENLSRMRNRLDPARYKPIDTALIDSPPDHVDHASAAGGYAVQRQTRSRKERPVSDVYASSSPSAELYRHSAPSNALIALLSEKVERQNKMIEQLCQQVQTLDSDRRRSEVKVHDLEHQVNLLTTRLSSHGPQYQAEQSLNGWQQDVRTRLDQLHERVNKHMMSGTDPYHSESALTSITQELQNVKRGLQSECDSLHHEIETVRSRLVKQEMDLSGQTMHSKDMATRIDKLDRKLVEVSVDQRQMVLSHLGTLSGPQQDHSQAVSTHKDIRDIKTEMSKLLRTLSRIDSQASRVSSLSNPSTVSTTTVSSTRSSRHQKWQPRSSSSHKLRGRATLGHERSELSDGDSSSSLEDVSDSELSLPLSISHHEESHKTSTGPERKKLILEDEDDDFSLSLSDLEVSEKDGDFGSTLSLDSDQLDLDLM